MTCCSHCGCSPCRCANQSHCPFPCWLHPLCCNPTHFCSAGNEDGPTLIIHKIVLNECGGQSCTRQTFQFRIVGPSFPNGEVFRLRAGSCRELDEPLVISGLIPGEYLIEELLLNPCDFISTITGPVCGNRVTICENAPPVVVTVVNRRRSRRLCRAIGGGCGCFGQCGCGGCGCGRGCGNFGGCGCKGCGGCGCC